MEHIRACLRDLRGCWKHKFLTKRQSFQWRKDFGLLFLVVSIMKKVKEQTRVQKVIWQVLCKLFDQFSWTKMSRSELFKKKGYLPGDKRIGHFFSCYRVWQASGDNLQAWKRYFNEYCGSYRINTVTPKGLLETQIFEKKNNFSCKNISWPLFSRIVEHDKRQGIVFKAKQRVLTSIVQATWWFI